MIVRHTRPGGFGWQIRHRAALWIPLAPGSHRDQAPGAGRTGANRRLQQALPRRQPTAAPRCRRSSRCRSHHFAPPAHVLPSRENRCTSPPLLKPQQQEKWSTPSSLSSTSPPVPTLTGKSLFPSSRRPWLRRRHPTLRPPPIFGPRTQAPRARCPGRLSPHLALSAPFLSFAHSFSHLFQDEPCFGPCFRASGLRPRA